MRNASMAALTATKAQKAEVRCKDSQPSGAQGTHVTGRSGCRDVHLFE